MATIDIPIGGEVLEINRRDLKENEAFVFNLLNDPSYVHPLTVYIDIALEYWKQGLRRQFEASLRSGLRRVLKDHPSPAEREQYTFLLTLLASFYTETAKSVSHGEALDVGDSNASGDVQSGRRTKDQLIVEATEHLNEALRLNSRDICAIVAAGNNRLAMKEYDEASQSFVGALSLNPNCVPALLGEASVRYMKNQFGPALELYQKVLSLKPNIRPDVRVPIGICYYQLGAIQQARGAFGRALKLNPDNSDALLLIAITDWNICRANKVTTSEGEALLSTAHSCLLSAFRNDKHHPLLISQLAYRKYLRKEYQEAIRLADMVLQNTEVGRLRAEALCCKGKALQAQRKYDDALRSFEEAVVAKEDSLPVHYGLAVMLFYRGRLVDACFHLEKILQRDPDNAEVMMRLASLYARSPSQAAKAIELYDKVQRMQLPDENYDPYIMIDVGGALERVNAKGALELYQKALEILEAHNSQIPPELYNNIAVMQHLLALSGQDSLRRRGPESASGKGTEPGSDVDIEFDAFSRSRLFTMARQSYDLALNACDGMGSGEGLRRVAAMTKLTVKYNQARLQETLGESTKAVESYQDILTACPAYTDCHLRLGAIYCDQGRFIEAVDHFKAVADSDQKNIEARLMTGTAYLKADEKVEAKRAFDFVLKSIDNQHMYALCALGNVQVALARSARHNPKEKEEWIFRAHKLYDAALKLDNRCIYAANGIGIILAERGQLHDAYTVFSQVEQATGNSPLTAMNLAHSLLALDEKDARVAIPLYEKALKKGQEDAYIIQSLARAYYILARERKDDSSMSLALHYIQKATKLQPGDTGIRFNLALVKQHMAVVLNDQPIEKRNLDAMRRAMTGIDTAERLFTALAERAPETRPNYNVTHAMHRQNYCKDVRKLAEKKIHETSTLERQREERRERIREEQRLREEERKRKELEEQEERRRQEEERERQRAEIQTRLQEDIVRSRQQDEEERERDDSRKKSKRPLSEDVSDNEEGSRQEKRRRIRRKSDRRQSVEEEQGEGSSISTTDEQPGERRSRKRAGVRSYLSKEIIEDSDEDLQEPQPKRGRTEGSSSDEDDAHPQKKSPQDADSE